MNRTQDTIILEKIFNERLELSIYKNNGTYGFEIFITRT